jgi:DNA-binding MarR family transcriptional regulator/GNAT superfamily N-acetyltransferase
MSFIEDLGALALWSRLRRLTESLTPGVVQIYTEQEVNFEPRWFTVTYYLWKKGPARLTDIVKALKLTHPSVIQTVNQMEREKIVQRSSSESDQRVTLVKLTPKGKRLCRKLEPVWDDIDQAARSLMAEACPDFLGNIEKLEASLNETDLYKRIKRAFVIRNADHFSLSEYNNSDHHEFRTMSLSWLADTVGITEHDQRVLTDPVEHILAREGKIFMARVANVPVGTFSLIPLDMQHVELSKFTIKEEYRGLGLGSRLADQAVLKAKEGGFYTILLLTHKALAEASSLYQKKGFSVVPAHPLLPDLTGRCSKTMQLVLKP